MEHITRDDLKARRYHGEDEYSNHRPGDERVVVFVQAEHMTRKDG